MIMNKLKQCCKTPYQIVFSDLEMPIMNGEDVSSSIQFLDDERSETELVVPLLLKAKEDEIYLVFRLAT